MVDKCQDWKGRLCFVLNGVMIEDMNKNIPFKVVKHNCFPVEILMGELLKWEVKIAHFLFLTIKIPLICALLKYL